MREGQNYFQYPYHNSSEEEQYDHYMNRPGKTVKLPTMDAVVHRLAASSYHEGFLRADNATQAEMLRDAKNRVEELEKALKDKSYYNRIVEDERAAFREQVIKLERQVKRLKGKK